MALWLLLNKLIGENRSPNTQAKVEMSGLVVIFGGKFVVGATLRLILPNSWLQGRIYYAMKTL